MALHYFPRKSAFARNRLIGFAVLLASLAAAACSAPKTTREQTVSVKSALTPGVTISDDLLRPFMSTDVNVPVVNLSAIARGPSSYLAFFGDSNSRLYVSRLDASGTPVDAQARFISEYSSTYMRSVLVHPAGDHYVAVWGASSPLRGMRIGLDGVPLDSSPVRPSSSGDVMSNTGAAIAANAAGDTLLVWQRASDGAIVAVPWDHAGAVGTLVTLSPRLTNAVSSAVSYDGTAFLVSWVAPASTTTDQISALRVNALGQPIDGTPIAVHPGRTGCRINTLSSMFDGTRHVLAWASRQVQTSPYQSDIYSARVTTDGTVIDPNGVPAGVVPGEYSTTVGATAQTDSNLILWTDQNVTRAIRISRTDGIPLDTESRAVLQGAMGQQAAASDGTDTLVVSRGRVGSYLQGAIGGASAPAGTAFARVGVDNTSASTVVGAGGYRIQWVADSSARAITLSPDGTLANPVSPMTLAPAVWGADAYLVLEGKTNAPSYIGELYATRFSNEGTPIDTQPILIASNGPLSVMPAVDAAVFGNGVYLAIFRTTSSKFIAAGSAMLLGDEGRGALLSAAGVPVADYIFPDPREGHGNLTAVAGSDGFAVAWTSYKWFNCFVDSSEPECAGKGTASFFTPPVVRVQKVMPNGTRAPHVQLPASDWGQLALATDGQKYLLVAVNGSNIIGQFLDANLNTQGTSFTIAASISTSTLRATFDGEHYVIAWSGVDTTSQQFQIMVKRLSSTGEVLDPNGIQIVTQPPSTGLYGVYSHGDGRALLTTASSTFPGTVHALLISPNNTGGSCARNDECENGHCVDGVCCDTECGGGNETDCQACSVATGSDTDGICRTLRADRICRPSIGTCDATESCDGSSVNCPNDDPSSKNGSVCDDGNPNTKNDACSNGACVGEAVASGGGGTSSMNIGGTSNPGGAGGIGTSEVGIGGQFAGSGGAATGGEGFGGSATGGEPTFATGGAATGGEGFGGSATGGEATLATGGAATGGAATGGEGFGGSATGGAATFAAGGVATGGAATGGEGFGGSATGGAATFATGGVATGGAATGGAATGGAATGGEGFGGSATGGEATLATGGAATGGAATGGEGFGGSATGGEATLATGGAATGGAATGGAATGGAATGGATTSSVATGGAAFGGSGIAGASTVAGSGSGSGGASLGGTGSTVVSAVTGGAATSVGGRTGTLSASSAGNAPLAGTSGINGDGDHGCGCSLPRHNQRGWLIGAAVGAVLAIRRSQRKTRVRRQS